MKSRFGGKVTTRFAMILFVSAVAPATAQEPAVPNDGPSVEELVRARARHLKSAAPASAETLDIEGGRVHFAAGASYYEQARYPEALHEFNEAFALSKKPPLLFNISLCHERLGNLDKAVEALEEYLAKDPTTRDRRVVESRIKSLTEMMQRVQTTAAPAAPSVAPRPAGPQGAGSAPRRRFTWVAGGAGALLLGGALAANLFAGSRLGDLRRQCGADGACDPSVFPGAASAIADGHGAALASYVLVGTAAVALAAAVVLFFVEGRR